MRLNGFRLEVQAEIGFDNFGRSAAFRIPEYQVVLDGIIHRRRKIKIDRLGVGIFHGHQSLAGAIAYKIGVLLIVENEEIDVGCVVGGAMRLSCEGLKKPVQMGLRGVRGDLEGKRCGCFQIECLGHDILRRTDGRGRHSIRRSDRACWRRLLFCATRKKNECADRRELRCANRHA